MRHLAPGGSGSDDFQNCYCCFFVFFEGGGGGGITWLLLGTESYSGGVKEK